MRTVLQETDKVLSRTDKGFLKRRSLKSFNNFFHLSSASHGFRKVVIRQMVTTGNEMS